MVKREDIAAALRDLRDQADSHAAMTNAVDLHAATAQWREVRALLDRALAVLGRIGDPL